MKAAGTAASKLLAREESIDPAIPPANLIYYTSLGAFIGKPAPGAEHSTASVGTAL